MTLHYNTLHRYIHAPGTQKEVIWGSNYRYCWSFVPFYHHSKHTKVSHHPLTISQGFSVAPFLVRSLDSEVKTCMEKSCQGCGGEQCQLCRQDAQRVATCCDDHWHSVEPPQSCKDWKGHGEKKTPLESEDLKKSDGFQVEHGFFSGCCWCFLLWFLERVLFLFLFGNLYAG